MTTRHGPLEDFTESSSDYEGRPMRERSHPLPNAQLCPYPSRLKRLLTVALPFYYSKPNSRRDPNESYLCKVKRLVRAPTSPTQVLGTGHNRFATPQVAVRFSCSEVFQIHRLSDTHCHGKGAYSTQMMPRRYVPCRRMVSNVFRMEHVAVPLLPLRDSFP